MESQILKWRNAIDKRVEQMTKEGVTFKCNSHIGKNIDVKKILRDYNAIVLACGSEALGSKYQEEI